MSTLYATDFTEIPTALANNRNVRHRMITLVASEPIVGKAIEEPNRLPIFREILRELTLGNVNIHGAIRRVSSDLPPGRSSYGHDRRVFPQGWEERIIRTQYSRFYNQAVLDELFDKGTQKCFVPHSSSEQPTNECSLRIAGRAHEVAELRHNLRQAYASICEAPT